MRTGRSYPCLRLPGNKAGRDVFPQGRRAAEPDGLLRAPESVSRGTSVARGGGNLAPGAGKTGAGGPGGKAERGDARSAFVDYVINSVIYGEAAVFGLQFIKSRVIIIKSRDTGPYPGTERRRGGRGVYVRLYSGGYAVFIYQGSDAVPRHVLRGLQRDFFGLRTGGADGAFL